VKVRLLFFYHYPSAQQVTTNPCSLKNHILTRDLTGSQRTRKRHKLRCHIRNPMDSQRCERQRQNRQGISQHVARRDLLTSTEPRRRRRRPSRRVHGRRGPATTARMRVPTLLLRRKLHAQLVHRISTIIWLIIPTTARWSISSPLARISKVLGLGGGMIRILFQGLAWRHRILWVWRRI